MTEKDAGFNIFNNITGSHAEPVKEKQQQPEPKQTESPKDEWLSVWNDALFQEVC